MDFSVFVSASAIIAALLTGLALPVAVVLTYSRFGVGVSLIALAFIAETITMGDFALEIGLKLYYPDILLLIVIIAALVRYITITERPVMSIAWIVFCIVFFISFFSGLLNLGSAAGVSSRSYFYLISTSLYGMSFNFEKKYFEILFHYIYAVSVFLIALTFYRWVVYYLPITNLLPPNGIYNNDGAIRVIYSHHVLLIGQIAIFTIFYLNLTPKIPQLKFLSPLLIGIVVVLQHRSVWLATISGIFTHFILSRNIQITKSNKANNMLYMVFVLLVATGISQFSDGLQNVSKQVQSGASTALAAEGSVGERIQSWQELLKLWINAGPRSVLIGQGFGSDNTRYVQNARGEIIKIDYTAHNFYIKTLYNMGLFGLLTYLFIVANTLNSLLKIRKIPTEESLSDVMIIILVTQLVFYIPYESDYLQGLIFGVIVAYSRCNVRLKESIDKSPKDLLKKTPSSLH